MHHKNIKITILNKSHSYTTIILNIVIINNTNDDLKNGSSKSQFEYGAEHDLHKQDFTNKMAFFFILPK